jgi:hypothetical protein
MVIYEIINTVNNKRYIGKDKHNNPNYFGSGKLINKAIEKYGKDKFIKVILEYCNSEEHMCERERYWIQITNAQHSDLYYNIGEGGNGGDNITHNPNRYEFIEKMKIINADPQYIRTRSGHSDTTKQNQSKAAEGRYTLNWFIKKYGNDKGVILYNERNKQLSGRFLSDTQKETLTNITKNDLIKLIKSGYTQEQLKQHYNITHKRLYKKYLEHFNTSKFKEVCDIINIFYLNN